jgi:DNA-binding CsgD family transcriptional regulator
MEYDIQELFIEGLTALEIAEQLRIDVDTVVNVLNGFGVAA